MQFIIKLQHARDGTSSRRIYVNSESRNIFISGDNLCPQKKNIIIYVGYVFGIHSDPR